MDSDSLPQYMQIAISIARRIANGDIPTKTVEKPKEKREMTLTHENFRRSDEYRSAFLCNLMGRDLTEEQRSAIALAGADPVVPEQMQNSILSKAKEYAPVLSDMEKNS